ncbi:MAG TPA: glycosyltransferase [Dehalococcoidia bacterium]|nr:glycosyltransferase [Dehalococcoidia bacterium]
MPAPHLSLVVPSFDEERRIVASLERIGAFLVTLDFDSEVIVVDDGSGEPGLRANEVGLARLPARVRGRLIRHEVNRGKGAAVRTGCLAAEGDYVAFIDADLATPPEDLVGLIRELDAGADVAIGIRRQEDGSDMRARRSLPRRAAGQIFAFAMRTLLLPDIADSQCPLKAFRRPAAQRLFRLQRIDTWSFDAEVLYLAYRLGLKVARVPVRWQAVAGSHFRFNLKSALELWNLLRIRLAHRSVSPRTLLEEAPEPAG